MYSVMRACYVLLPFLSGIALGWLIAIALALPNIGVPVLILFADVLLLLLGAPSPEQIGTNFSLGAKMYPGELNELIVVVVALALLLFLAWEDSQARK